MKLATVALVVREYDEAVSWFVDKLGFSIADDSDLGCDKRWVRVRAASGGSDLLLAKAVNPAQSAAIGNTGGGRVCFFLHTEDFWRDYRLLQSRSVHFIEEPRDEAYGWVVVFVDLYGNKWDLVGLKDAVG